MSSNFDRRFPPFHIGEHDRITIGGKTFRLNYLSASNAVLRPDGDTGMAESFAFEHLSRLNAAGKIKHEINFYLPRELRSAVSLTPEYVVKAPLSKLQQKRLDVSFAMAQAAVDLQDHSDEKVRIGKTEDDLAANMDRIRDLASDFLQDALPDPARIAKIQAYRDGKGKKPQGGDSCARPDAVHPSTLRKWIRKLRQGGKFALTAAYERRGNRTGYFSADENALMAKTIKSSFLSPQRLSIAATVRDVTAAFMEENEARIEKGLSELRVPSREAVRLYIRKLDKFKVVVARFGKQYAMRNMKPVGQGLEVLRPLERVEMDEWEVDIITTMKESGLDTLFSHQELIALGLIQADTKEKKAKDRWWLVVAIDCRTRVILGMQRTRAPKTTAALECLRMALEDKGQLADAVGALSPWNTFGKPESILTDNGCFKSKVFTNCCAELRITMARTIGGQPAMRGRIESFFDSAAEGVCSRLSGRTFSTALKRGDYDSDTRICIDTENFSFAMTRWIIDVYHNSSHAGLGGLTPLEQWERDHAEGNYPLHAAPTPELKRAAFGVRLRRSLLKNGITILGVRYHSEELANWFLTNGGRDLDLRWDHSDIGAISVCLDNHWVEVASVHQDGDGNLPFGGLHVQEWLAVRRALQTRSEQQKLWNEKVAFAAIKEIREMNTARMLQFKISNHDWDAVTLDATDRSQLFDGFKVTENKAQTSVSGDSYGRAIEPVAPADFSTPATIRSKPVTKNNFAKKGSSNAWS